MMSDRSGLLVVITAAMSLLLAACGSAEPTATPTPVPDAGSAQEPVATVAPVQTEWEALIEAAQGEEELVIVFQPSGGRNYRPLVAIFEERFGIKVVVSVGSGSAQANRILAEQTAGRYLADVFYSGEATSTTRMVPGGALDPIPDLLVHPEVTDQSLWYQGQHWYADADQKYVFNFAATAAPTSLALRYNTDLVTQEDLDAITSVFDYLDLKWKGMIVAHIPGGGGSGAYVTSYVHPEIGPEWLDRFVSPELDVTFSEDRRFIVDGVANGKFALGIAIGGAGMDLDSMTTLGAPVGSLIKELKEGGSLSNSGNNIMALTRAPNPNSAALWINWFLTKEGQTLMHTLSERDPDPTLRDDVTEWGITREFDRRVEGKTYYNFATDPAYIARRQEALDYARSVYEASR